jgi:hypothetical protein
VPVRRRQQQLHSDCAAPSSSSLLPSILTCSPALVRACHLTPAIIAVCALRVLDSPLAQVSLPQLFTFNNIRNTPPVIDNNNSHASSRLSIHRRRL